MLAHDLVFKTSRRTSPALLSTVQTGGFDPPQRL